MATCTFAVGTADDGNTPNASDGFTPVLGENLVVFVEASTTVDAAPTITSSVGLGFTLRKHQTHNGGGHSLYIFNSDGPVVDATAGQTVTFSTPSDTANATIIFVYRVSGITKTGAAAVKQVGGSLGTAPNTPNFDFGASCQTGNPTLCLFSNTSNPAGITAPTDWTEPVGGDLGTSAPAFGGAVCHRDSGFTGTTVTWGSNSANAWGTCGIELDASADALISRAPRRLPLQGVA